MSNILRRLCHASWLLLKWTTILVILFASAIGLYLYHNLNDEIRLRALQKLQQQYPDLKVSIRSAQFVEGQGVEIRGIQFAKENATSQSLEKLISIDELFVHCTTDPKSLVQGKFSVNRVIAKRPHLHVIMENDGSFNLQSMLPLPKFGKSQAEFEIIDALIDFQERGNPDSRIVFDNIDFKMNSEMVPLDGYADATYFVKRYQLEGTFDQAELKRSSFQGFVEPETQAFQFQGEIERLKISSELTKRIPQKIGIDHTAIAPLQLTTDLHFHVSHAPRLQSKPNFLIQGQITQGSWQDPKLPVTVTNILGNYQVDQTGIMVGPLSVNVDSGTVNLKKFVRASWQSDARVHLELEAKDFFVRSEYAQLLPEKLQQDWDQFQPQGLINIAMKADYAAGKWDPEIHVQCLDAGVTYHKFPYPVKHTTGRLDLRQDVLSINLMTFAGNTPMKITGKVENLGPDASADIRIQSQQAMPIDQTLSNTVKQISPKLHRVFESMHAEALMNVDFHVHDAGGPNSEPQKHMVVDIIDGSMRYEHFQYPIQKIHGRMIWKGDQVIAESLEGYNDSAHILCKGTWEKVPTDPRGLLQLNFTCKDVPLDDELRSALPNSTQNVWAELRPRGTVDHLDINLRFPGVRKNIDVQLEAQKWERDRNVAGRTVSVEPRGFRYLLDDVQGTVTYDNGVVQLYDMKARHGEVRLRTGGQCNSWPDGRWQIHFQGMHVERVFPDRDLLSALPSQLEKAIRQLQLSSAVLLQGDFVLTGSAEPGSRPDVSWDFQVFLAGADAHCGIPLKSIFGAVRFFGQSTNESSYTYGELALDSLNYNGLIIRNVQGPFVIDAKQAILGSQVPVKEGQSPRNVIGNTLGGTVVFDAVSWFQEDKPFSIYLKLVDGSLAQSMIDLGQQNPGKNTGTITGELRLGGTAEGSHTYNGRGKMNLTNANLYELPVVVSLLKILRARAPDSTAFTSGEINFDIKGEYLYMNRIKLSGDAISLRGKGEATLSKDISMRFYSEFGNNTFDVPIIKPLLGQASRQLLVIHVTGTLDNPQTEQEIFPLVNQTLEQIFPENSVIPLPGLPRIRNRQSQTGVNNIPR